MAELRQGRNLGGKRRTLNPPSQGYGAAGAEHPMSNSERRISVIGRWAFGVGRFLVADGTRRINPCGNSKARSGLVRLVYGAGAVSPGARLLRVRPRCDWPSRRLLHER